MCGPLVVPLALMAAGTVANYFGDRQAQKAQNRTYKAERERQKTMTSEQNRYFEDSVSKTGAVSSDETQGAAAAKREALIRQALPTGPREALPGNSDAPQVVQTAADAANAEAGARTDQRADAMGRLFGFGDTMFDNAIDRGRNSEQIGQLASFKRGSAGVLDAELQAAAQKGAFLRGIGQLAQKVGGAMAGGAGGATGPMSAASFGQAMQNPVNQLPGGGLNGIGWGF